METIEKVGKTIEPIQKDQPVLSPRIASEVVNISDTNLENSKSGEVMSTTGTSTGTGTGSGPVLGDMKPKDSGESQLSGGTVPQQALQRPQGQGPVIQQDSSTASKPNAGTGAGTGTGVGVGSTENASRQIPPIHDIQIPSMSAGGAIRNGNLLGGHGGSGSTSTSQFSNFNGVGSGHPLPRAPALQDVTSGSHPELLRRSSSNISDAGVGIPRQLVDVTQSSNMLLSKPNINPVIQSTSSGVSGTNGSESTMPVLNGANMSASSSMAYGNMLTPNMRPLNQMTMALPNQSSATSMSQQAQHHPQQKQHPPSQQQSQSQLPQQQQKQQLSQNIQQQGTSQPQSQQQQQYLLNNSNNNNSSANPAVGSYAPGGPQTTSNAPKKGRWGSGQPMPPKPWHTTEHNPERAEMNKRIVNLLQQRRPDASPEWYQKLPQMAKRLEEALYGEAQSFEMYNNFSTLKGRLQQLALSMSGKVGASKSAAASTSAGAGVGPPQGQEMTAENIQMMKQQQLYKQQQQQQQHVANMQQMQHQQQHGSNFQQQSQQQVRSYPNNSNYNQRPQGQQGQPNYQLPNYQQTNGAQPMTIATESAGGLLQGGQLLQPNMHQTTNTGAQPGAAGRYVNMNNLNPTLYANPGPKSTQAAPPSKETAKETKAKKETKPKATSKAAPMSAIAKATAGKQAAAESKATSKGKKRGASGGDNEPPTKVAKTKKPTKKELAEEAKRTANLEKANNTALANVAKNKNASATQGGHTDDHRRAVLKQQIQRLLLLRHASKCPHEANRCPVTTHCFAMKSLWKHLMKCKDQECKVAHCVSSRYVLSHYSKCQDPQCPVCGPVRASIRKASNENHEIVQSLNKKSEPAVVSKQPVPEEPKAPAGPQPPDTLSSAIYNFTDEQIKYHVSHLHDGLRMKASEIKTHCIPLVDDMIRNPNGYIFSSPVDPVKLMIPDYPEIIKRPMDLGTVRKRLENGHYRDIVECSNDIRLTFDNAMLYNPTSSDVHKCARFFKTQFEKSFRFKLDDIEKATEERRADPDSCRLCGEKDTFFELPNYYCNGKCASRIKRNAVFYSDDKNTLHWCQSCFNDLRDPIKVVGAANIFKKDLKKGKLQGETDELREPMVQCDSCERWVHSVCGLFNSRRNLSKEMQYFCPQCVLQQRAKLPPKDIVPEKKMLANTLPQCLMTEYIEKRVAAALEVAYEESAAKLGIPVSAVEKAPRLSIRQVSCIDNNQATQEGMRTRYAHKNYPVEFPCRAKCILMFQHMDGQDVILFGMYVYEYGHKCPQPNQRRVYISYLDSVHYLRPRQYRTPVYHEILIAYLEYVKMRGFHTAHIWACPPMPKDDYIFNIHPPDQKTPKQERLRQWYVSMLDKCVARGIVQEVNDLHTEYMADESNDATVLPYLDGDYWVGVAEDIIKKLSIDDQYPDEGDANVANDSKSKRKKTKKATAPPKRSRGRQPRGTSSSSATSLSGRDPVMEKLSATIEPMKHDFFVARLHSKEYITACTRMAEVEKDEETDKAGDKEKNDKKLQEEALSSGDGGKSGKMKKMVTQTSENVSSGNIGAVPATNAINKTLQPVQSSSVLKMDANNGGFVDPFNTKVQSANSLTPSTASSLPIANERTIASSEGDKMEVDDDVALKTETSSKDPAVSAVINGQATGTSAIKGMGESSVEGEGSGLLASVSKLASSFFGNGNGGGDGVSSASVEDPSTKMEVDESGNGGENVTMYEQNTGEEKSSADIEKNGVSKMSVEESNVVVKVEPLATTTTNTAPTNSNKTVKVEASVNPVATGGCELKSSSTDATSNSAAVSVKEEDKRIICHTPTKDTEDRDDTQECEHFETRLSFLQLCQGNHYQFDQLRRAKHTSMMVLYHLHNPDAPKFMAVCSIPTCSQSIVTGTRFHCETCDIDFCQACYVTMKNDQKARHIHPLRPMPVSGSSSVQPLTEEQRRERNRSIQLHLQLLLHSARDCVGKTCASKNCEKMKEFLKHEPTCKVGFKKGCPTCKKVLNLLNLHARSCRVDQCPVPKCMEIKEKTRQNQLKQRQMDDRRRQMMNDMYRGSGGG